MGQQPLLGDALVIVGATLYAASNVLTEHVLAQANSIELLAGMGGFGFLWSLGNIATFEIAALARIHWQGSVVAFLVAYTAALFGFYCGAMKLLQNAGSVVRPAAAALVLADAISAWKVFACRVLPNNNISLQTARQLSCIQKQRSLCKVSSILCMACLQS